MKKILWSIFLLTIFVSCNHDDDMFDIHKNNFVDCNVPMHFSVEPFVGEVSTRASIGKNVIDEDPFTFYFNRPKNSTKTGDQFGIYCLENGRNYPLFFTPASKTSVNSDKDLSSMLNFETLMNYSYIDDYGNEQPFVENGNRYVIYYPYDAYAAKNKFVLFNHYGAQNSKNVVNRNYFFSDVLTYNDGMPSNIVLHPMNSIIDLKIKGLDDDIKCLEIVNVDGLGKFYTWVSCGVVSNKITPDISKCCKMNSIALGVDAYVMEDDYTDFYMCSYPTTTGKFAIRITTADDEVYYSEEVYDSRTIESGHWYVITCDGVTQTPPDFMYDDIDFGSGMYYVDLGVPCVKWSIMNLGAVTPTDIGMECSWDADDISTRLWGYKWKTPAAGNIAALCKFCYWEYTTNYKGTGVAGYMVFKSKGDGYVINNDGKLNFSALDGPYYWCYNYHKGYKPTVTEKELHEKYNPDVDTHIFLPCTESDGITGHYMTSDYDYLSSSSTSEYFRLDFWKGQSIPEVNKVMRNIRSFIRPVYDKGEY